MTMEARQDFKRAGADEALQRNKAAEDRRGARSRGAGLYAEVRPISETRSLAFEALEDAD